MTMFSWTDLNVAQETEINFTGKKKDQETELYYFNQRYYDAEIGRFLTHDPANQLYNPYVYAGNNPVRFVDPTGETFFEALTFAGALFGAAIGAYQGHAIGGNIVGGAFEGALSGIMIGGTLGLVMDAAQVWGGSTSTYGSGTGRTAWGMYVAAWNGKLGASVDVPFGGSEPGGSNSSSASSASSTSIDYKRLLNNRHQLYFDGSSLSAKDSYGTMLHRWEALSNSKSEYLLNGKTPQGTYLVDSIYLTIESGMVDKNGVGYKARLQYKGDNWPSERDIRTFYIHPDGGYVGATNGCIGVSSSCSQEVYDYLTLYIRSYSYIYVNVRY